MCIIVVIPAGAPLPSDQTLHNCWNNNDDGAGIMFVADGSVEIVKNMKFQPTLEQLKNVYENVGQVSPIIVHFRVGTCGDKSAYNVHPFPIFQEGDRTTLAYCHNGQLFSPPHNSKESDSHLFALMQSTLPPGFHKNAATLALLKEYAKGDKLVYLDNEGYVCIVNEPSGTWDGGVWYSNSGYKFGRNIQYNFENEDYEGWHWGLGGYHQGGMGVAYNADICEECTAHVGLDKLKWITYGDKRLHVCRDCILELYTHGIKLLLIDCMNAHHMNRNEFELHLPKE